MIIIATIVIMVSTTIVIGIASVTIVYDCCLYIPIEEHV